MKRAKDDVGWARMTLYLIFAVVIMTEGLWSR